MMKYQTAERIIDLLELGQDVFVRIKNGNKKGSILKVIQVERENYSSHKYRLAALNERPFWIIGNDIEELIGYEGSTSIIRNVVAEPKVDCQGNEIKLYSMLIYFRVGSDNVDSAMIVGQVRRIHAYSGAIYVRPMKINDREIPIEIAREIRLARPDRAMVLDERTIGNLLLLKLTC